MNAVTVSKISPPAQAQVAEVPPLNAGDSLTRAEFERIYEAHPEIKKAELLEGVVCMPSLIGITRHSEPHAWLTGWLAVYCAATPGVRLGDNGTVRLDWENEVQPDAFLWLETKLGGKARVTADDFLEGSPEFIAEVAASSAAYDLHIKKRVYQRSGVQEYLAIQIHEKRVDWFALQEGVYTNLPEEEGSIKSKVLPGLWFNVTAFWAGNNAQLLATVQEGIASAEHREFVKRLQTEPQ